MINGSSEDVADENGEFVDRSRNDAGQLAGVSSLKRFRVRFEPTRNKPRRRFRPRGGALARNITGCAVKAGARGMDIGITTVGPIDEVRHRLQQGLAQRGQTIFDTRRFG